MTTSEALLKKFADELVEPNSIPSKAVLEIINQTAPACAFRIDNGKESFGVFVCTMKVYPILMRMLDLIFDPPEVLEGVKEVN